jgi:hypothetical protein
LWAALSNRRCKRKCANLETASIVHHYGALGASIGGEGGERFICALCEGLIQRVLTRFLLVKICDNCLPRMEAQQKQCIKCGIIKPFHKFGKSARHASGLLNECKQCKALYEQQIRIKTPVQALTSEMLASARKRAKKKNLAFNLDLDYVRSLVRSNCSLLPEISLEWSTQCRNGIPLPNSPSLDRIDPTKGYVKGNVWIVSHRANTLKGNATHDELKAITENTGRAIVDSIDW